VWKQQRFWIRTFYHWILSFCLRMLFIVADWFPYINLWTVRTLRYRIRQRSRPTCSLHLTKPLTISSYSFCRNNSIPWFDSSLVFVIIPLICFVHEQLILQICHPPLKPGCNGINKEITFTLRYCYRDGVLCCANSNYHNLYYLFLIGRNESFSHKSQTLGFFSDHCITLDTKEICLKRLLFSVLIQTCW
jgi:hypothetical protein